MACDMLGVMGFENQLLDFLPECEARSLVGEGVAAQEMGVVVASMLCALRSPGLFAAARD
eukprot:8185297-Alexandrium_andersonii.AAC.1